MVKLGSYQSISSGVRDGLLRFCPAVPCGFLGQGFTCNEGIPGTQAVGVLQGDATKLNG